MYRFLKVASGKLRFMILPDFSGSSVLEWSETRGQEGKHCILITFEKCIHSSLSEK